MSLGALSFPLIRTISRSNLEASRIRLLNCRRPRLLYRYVHNDAEQMNAAAVAASSASTKTTEKSHESLSTQKSRNVVAERSYFDTHSFVKSMQQNGFSENQAEALCSLFKDIVNFIAQDIKKECVTKPGQVNMLLFLLNLFS
jgi:hypothetical protein